NDPGTVKLWDAVSGRPHGPALCCTSPIATAIFSPDSSMVFIGDGSGTGRVWDITTLKPIGPVLRHVASISAAAFAPDSRLLVTGDNDGMAQLWTLPEPVTGEAGQIASWVEQITGKKLQTLPMSASQVAVSSTEN